MPERRGKAPYHITTLNEKPLHAALKSWYARPGDHTEIYADGFLIDVVRDDRLVEIQTRGFGKIRRKLETLVRHHKVRLVYPVAREKWILRTAKDGSVLSRRKSPRRGGVEDVFRELVSLPELAADRNFSLEVLLIREEEVRTEGRNWRRRGWRTSERRLIDVVERHVFECPADFAALLPADLPEPFTTADLASARSIPRPVAQRMCYCLRRMGALREAGKKGNAILYLRQDVSPST